jgi:DNA-binding LacI/PurR family transcriptional regulator
MGQEAARLFLEMIRHKQQAENTPVNRLVLEPILMVRGSSDRGL